MPGRRLRLVCRESIQKLWSRSGRMGQKMSLRRGSTFASRCGSEGRHRCSSVWLPSKRQFRTGVKPSELTSSSWTAESRLRTCRRLRAQGQRRDPTIESVAISTS
jgi:hypothetical protein